MLIFCFKKDGIYFILFSCIFLKFLFLHLCRLLAQHGITLQATPGISDLQNGSILTINGVETLPQTSDVESALTNGTTEIVFSSTGSVENQVTTADGLPIVGNQMLCVPNMSQTLTFVTDYGIANSNMVQGEDYNTISLQYKIQPFEHFVDRKVRYICVVIPYLAPEFPISCEVGD